MADTGRPAKRPTMADVAAKAGVSRTLVSLVLSGSAGPSAHARERVLHAAHELGYRPNSAARLLARSRSGVLGVLLAVGNPFHAELVEAIYPTAEKHGYDVLLSAYVATRSERDVIGALLDHKCEALLVLNPIRDRLYLKELSRRTPAVIVGPRPRGVDVDCVHTAFGKGVREAVDHLVTLGHRSIVHIDGGAGFGASQRRTAYRNAMRRHGLAQYTRIIGGDYTEMSGVQVAQALLREPRLPDAVLAANDRCAIGVLDVFVRAGVNVPEDISVVGYDDGARAALPHINLTTVRQDTPRMGELAVEVAAHRLANPEAPRQKITLPPTLVVRGTSGPVLAENFIRPGERGRGC
jgi:DNA-binding LacI/PurR family transcriptional regulator